MMFRFSHKTILLGWLSGFFFGAALAEVAVKGTFWFHIPCLIVFALFGWVMLNDEREALK